MAFLQLEIFISIREPLADGIAIMIVNGIVKGDGDRDRSIGVAPSSLRHRLDAPRRINGKFKSELAANRRSRAGMTQNHEKERQTQEHSTRSHTSPPLLGVSSIKVRRFVSLLATCVGRPFGIVRGC